ncbi:MAG: polyprenyl synthetase family protein [Bacteroidota bacterium]
MTADAFRRLAEIRAGIERRLTRLSFAGSPRDLRDACRYVIRSGGKRIRGAMVVLSCQAVGGSAARAVNAAAAVELLHNFTLVHDDIMDNAAVRRGRPTVHKRWNVNHALLVGDVLLGTAYEVLLESAGSAGDLLAGILTRGLADVCDGQAMDLAFERRADVTVPEYFRMIEMKTAKLIATAAELGGVIGGATRSQGDALRRFALRLGRAFQLQDDLLDVVADPRHFGKSTGGDILEGKRTYLLLTAAARARGNDRTVIRQVLSRTGPGSGWKSVRGHVTGSGRTLVAEVKSIYERLGVLDDARRLVRRSTTEALAGLDRLPPSPARETLRALAEDLVTRAS